MEEQKNQNQIIEDVQAQNAEETIQNAGAEKSSGFNIGIGTSILISAILISGTWVYSVGLKSGTLPKTQNASVSETTISELEEKVLPSEGVVLPAVWGDLGLQLVNSGAIDADKFKSIYEQRDAFAKEYENLLLGKNNGKLRITNENSGYLLNLLWALGLANKNPILENGEMADPRYGGAENFASTAGWTIAKGNAMEHYSKHRLLELTDEQQALVEKVSKGVYRPCCGNSTHFPDCNHGMAMLGLLELMASQNASEQEMWNAALAVNSYWFPDTYLTIATYMKNKGIEWENVDPIEILGADYSSASGYRKISSQTAKTQKSSGGSGCGIDSAPAPQQQSGCGI